MNDRSKGLPGRSLADTVLLLGLIWLFVRADGGSVVDLLTGTGAIAPEIRLDLELPDHVLFRA